MLKNYEVSYRKRGLPDSDVKKMLVQAESFPGAMYLASQQAGEEYVVLGAKMQRDDDDEERSDNN